MSVKENLDFIKEEISTEEKFFEGFFKLEKVWAKYKLVVIGGGVLAIASFVGINVNNYLQTQTKIKANTAFNILLENPKDTSAIAILQDTNPKLLTIANYLASKQNKDVNIQFLDKVSSFNMAIDENNLEKLNTIMLDPKFLLKEYALFQKALIQTLDQKYVDAKETLKLIPASSPVVKLSSKLNHYLLTK